ncbi:C-X-C chemokine receptor type 3 [Bagarius yarrelli]|uniref:C-X-C chemokine receptor type 3 n=1 Tax=Bagarius yarrelli TaxID=175774 RepID=A0A556V1M6_BAGYA|nr:C-X-C chemokine receptor type 3 [Bagarius yarrelli]
MASFIPYLNVLMDHVFRPHVINHTSAVYVQSQAPRWPPLYSQAPRWPPFTAKPQNGHRFTAKPQNGHHFTAKPQNGHHFTAKPQDDHLFTAKPQDGPRFTAKPQNGRHFTAKPQNGRSFRAEFQNGRFTVAELQDGGKPVKPLGGYPWQRFGEFEFIYRWIPVITKLDLRGIFEHNGTFDYSDYDYKEDCITGRSLVAVIVTVLYSAALVLGLLGNVLVLVVLWQKRCSWSVTDAFVLHLSIVDVSLLLTLPLWAVDAVDGWSFGTGFCKLTGALFKINFYCSILLLVCISLDLYISVVCTGQTCSLTKPFLVQLICLAVWFFSVLLSIPDWIYLKAASDSSEQEDNIECVYEYSSKESRITSRLFHHVVGVLLPVTVLFYSVSHVLLQCRSTKGVSKLRNMRAFLVLVLVFLISWTPYNIALLVDTVHFSSRKPTELCEPQRWTAVKITAVLGLLHSCLNPLIYFGFSEKFKQWVLTIVKCGSSAVDSGDFFLWDSREIHNAKPVPQEENGSLQPIKTIQQPNTEKH